MADRGRPIPIGAAIYASAHKAVQPPDDRTYSAEVTAFRRNLLHHRIARAVFPYTRSIMIPPVFPFVKENFRKNHKNYSRFSCNLRLAFFAFPGFRFSPCPFSRARYSISQPGYSSRLRQMAVRRIFSISSFYSAVSRQTAWAVRNVLTSFFSGSGRWPQSCGLIKRF